MRILMLNWRCPKNPKSGGAEYVTQKHMSYWASQCHEVIWLTGGYAGCTREEMIDGVRIIRYGTPITIYLLAPLLYYFKWRGDFDVVVDQIHGIPFLTPLWAWKSRKIAFIHEVAQEIWDEMLPFPINIIGKLYEKIYFAFYRHTPFWTDSNSTRDDLVKYGIPEKNITVIPCAIDLIPVSEVPEKEPNLTLLFVGRLVKMKGVEDAITIFSRIKDDHADAMLWIVGAGEESYVKKLKALVAELNLSDSVVFRGYVSEEEKVQAYRRAHFLLHTSIREGFGLTVLEANSQGTPVIAYDVPGLRDIVVDGHNGMLIRNDAFEIDSALNASKKYRTLAVQSVKMSKNYNWQLMTQMSMLLLAQKPSH